MGPRLNHARFFLECLSGRLLALDIDIPSLGSAKCFCPLVDGWRSYHLHIFKLVCVFDRPSAAVTACSWSSLTVC